MTEVTLTELRSRLFELADSALATGRPVTIRRNGAKLLLKREADSDPRDRLLAYLEIGQKEGEASMSEEDRRLFDLSDVLEIGDSDEPWLYD